MSIPILKTAGMNNRAIIFPKPAVLPGILVFPRLAVTKSAVMPKTAAFKEPGLILLV
jgi:hypothetical protein